MYGLEQPNSLGPTDLLRLLKEQDRLGEVLTKPLPWLEKDLKRAEEYGLIKIDLVILHKILHLCKPVELGLDDCLSDLYNECGGKSKIEGVAGEVRGVKFIEVELKFILLLFKKMLDIKNDIHSIGLKDGFIVSTNLHDRSVYGVISDNANLLISGKYKESLKKDLDSLKRNRKENEEEKERRNVLEKALSDERCLYNLYHEEILKSPMNRLMYFNLIMEIITIYLYVLSQLLEEMV